MTDGALCLANIAGSGVARRKKLAAIGLAVAIAGLVAIDLLDLSFRWRGALLLPFWFASLCWFQAASKT
jgi:hypothetical protein